MGLMLAEPGFHTRCFVEWEEYPRSVLIAAQRAGYLAPAPIWDDLTTFDARPLAGAIDTLIAEYPCQPFSLAGKRMGEDDPRHLWPHVRRVAEELGPSLEWLFLENVAGHLTLGGETVLRALHDMGFTPAAGLFSAGEVGAPHERQRLFIVAHRERGAAERHRHQLADAARNCEGKTRERERIWPDSWGGGPGMADPDGGRLCPEREQRGGELGRQPESGSPCGCDVDDAASARSAEARIWPDERWDRIERREQVPCDGCGEMADASQPGSQGRERRGSSGERNRAPAPGPVAECGRLPLFPPGPADADAWAAVLGSSPHRVPSLARREPAAAALRFAALLDPDTASRLERLTRGMEASAILAEMGSEAFGMVEQAEAFAGLCLVAHGMAHRSRALRLLGDGVVPLETAYAWRSLSPAHGLWPVDLDAADGNCGADADGPFRE